MEAVPEKEKKIDETLQRYCFQNMIKNPPKYPSEDTKLVKDNSIQNDREELAPPNEE